MIALHIGSLFEADCIFSHPVFISALSSFPHEMYIYPIAGKWKTEHGSTQTEASNHRGQLKLFRKWPTTAPTLLGIRKSGGSEGCWGQRLRFRQNSNI